VELMLKFVPEKQRPNIAWITTSSREKKLVGEEKTENKQIEKLESNILDIYLMKLLLILILFF